VSVALEDEPGSAQAMIGSKDKARVVLRIGIQRSPGGGPRAQHNACAWPAGFHSANAPPALRGREVPRAFDRRGALR
jgi:hypothetical protein